MLSFDGAPRGTAWPLGGNAELLALTFSAFRDLGADLRKQCRDAARGVDAS
jgi:hypothetical protein